MVDVQWASDRHWRRGPRGLTSLTRRGSTSFFDRQEFVAHLVEAPTQRRHLHVVATVSELGVQFFALAFQLGDRFLSSRRRLAVVASVGVKRRTRPSTVLRTSGSSSSTPSRVETARDFTHTALVVDRQRGFDGALEERPVVADDDECAGPVVQEVLEHSQRLDVEVIGGLVQQQDVGLLGQYGEQLQSSAFATREVADS